MPYNGTDRPLTRCVATASTNRTMSEIDGMFPLTVDVPEPFGSALANRTSLSVCQAVATTPAELFGRGLNRMAAGDLQGARADLVAAQSVLGDPCRVELAQLAIRERRGLAEALTEVESVIKRAPSGSALAARATHLAGVLQLKSGELDLALETLSRAAKMYDDLACRLGHAQVHDSIGMAHSELGRLDRALEAYSLSLADKTLLGDLEGQAIALGNLGRVNLQSLRFQEALDCFQRDLELATRLDDKKSLAQLHNHLGQAWLGLEEFTQAASEFEQSLALAAAGGYRDVEFSRSRIARCCGLPSGATTRPKRTWTRRPGICARHGTRPALVYSRGAGRDLCRAGRFASRRDVRRSGAGLHQAKDAQPRDWLPPGTGPGLGSSWPQARGRALPAASRCAVRVDGYARHLKSVREALAALGLVETAPQERRRLLAVPTDGESEDYLQARTAGAWPVR